MKSILKRILGLVVVIRLVRMITRNERIPFSAREAVHRKIGKKIPLQGEFVVDVFGQSFTFEHQGVGDTLFWLGSYEPETTELFKMLAKDARLVVDIGARDGMFSFMASVASPTARILAFEPDPDAFAMLSRNIERNKSIVGDRIQPFQVALSDENGTAEFFLAGGTSSLNPDFRPGSKSIQVKVRTGDEVVVEMTPAVPIDVMKIDTESTEPQVLAGFAKRIESDRPAIIVEVLKGRTEDDLERFLETARYVPYRVGQQGPEATDGVVADPTYEFPNYLFLPVERQLEHRLSAASDGS